MIHYDEYGAENRKTIMFLHKEGVVDSFCKQYGLADKYHLVIPHLFGAGEETDESYNPKKQVKELIKLIEYLGDDDIILVGHSVGAGLAVMLANECPKYFEKIVFCSPSTCNSSFTVTIQTIKAHIKGMLARFGSVQRMQADYYGFNEAQRKKFLEYAKNITPEHYRAWCWNAINIDECVHFHELELPMLSLCGENEDGGVMITVAELANLNPNCRIERIKGAGHFYTMRNAEEFNQILLKFLEEDIEIIPIEG